MMKKLRLLLLLSFSFAQAAVLDVVNESNEIYSISCSMQNADAFSSVVHGGAEMSFTAPGVWTCDFGRYANTDSNGKASYDDQFSTQFKIDSNGDYSDSPILSGPFSSNGGLCFWPPSKAKIYIESEKLIKSVTLNWKSTKVYGPLKGQRIASDLARQVRRAFDNSSYRYAGRFDPASNVVSVTMKTALCGV
jgi:hypothetical protein